MPELNENTPTVDITSDLSTTLYYLLYAKYGNSTIASQDPEQFKYKVFTTIFMYAPAWKMRLQIQEKLLNLSPDDASVSEGTVMLYNHAENPDTTPTSGTFDTLGGINSQNTSNVKRGKLEGYAMLSALISTDVTEEFLGKFKKLFLKVVSPQRPLWYGEVGEEDSLRVGCIGDSNEIFGNYIQMKFTDIWDTAAKFVYDYEHNGIPTTI